MLTQIRDRQLLDDGFDDFDAMIAAGSTTPDCDDEADLDYVTRELEHDFTQDYLGYIERKWLGAQARLRVQQNAETADERRLRTIAWLRSLVEAIETRGTEDIDDSDD